MILKVYEKNISERHLDIVIDYLINDGVIIYPTDTVYAFGCSLYSRKGMEKISRLKNLPPGANQYSLICKDLSDISEYTTQVDTKVFKIMKRALPGPYTFILKANSLVPKIFKSKKKTIGIRVPNNKLVKYLVETLGHPLVSSSVIASDDMVEYSTNPELIHERYKADIDVVIDGGVGGLNPSAVLDCSGKEIEILRAEPEQLERIGISRDND